MKYETFEAEFIKQNKQLRLVLGVAILLMISILFFIITDKKYFALKNSKLVSNRPLLTWVCQESFESIAKGIPHKDLISDSILSEISKGDFKVSVDETLSALEIKENLCRIIVKGDGKVRSFLVSFKNSSDYPFYYKLSEITESELSLDELSKTSEAK